MTVDSEEDGQNSLVRQIARGFQATLLARTLSTAAKGLLLVILTRYLLSPDQFGLLFYAISVLAVAHLFATLGFAKSTARYVSEFMETDRAQVRHIIRVGLKYNLLAIAFVGIVLFGFHEHIAAALNEPALAPFLLIGPAYVGFKSLRVFLRLIFQGFNRVEWSAVVAVVASVCQLVFVVGFVLLDNGTIGAFVGYVVGLAVTSIVGFTVLYQRFYSQLDEADTIKEGLSRRVLKYNFPLAWTRGAGTLDGRVDILLVGYFLTPAAVGFYTLGKQISQFVMMPATALGFVVSPTTISTVLPRFTNGALRTSSCFMSQPRQGSFSSPARQSGSSSAAITWGRSRWYRSSPYTSLSGR
jgi:O-antigen/teichoic acid export membrane protein